ncbi:unnamed protein product [Darwinula stevensoni]|uniref:Uncharacterized protein n=1 Tax=Darwinula stevensoni TaxID=69355 RepID=A0A7R9A7K3_9CRUS|nr:unnamed protein product [Darwinula stevensoni]CAG0893792.1 unnamed protein product [Darwinula stevensoni]
MSDPPKPIGRGGRAQALLAQIVPRRPGQHQDVQTQEAQSPVQAAVSGPALGLPRGRGALLDRIRQSAGDAAMGNAAVTHTALSATATTEPQATQGRGRAFLMEQYKKKSATPGSTDASLVGGPPSLTSSSPSEVGTGTETRISDLSITGPIIRRGKAGTSVHMAANYVPVTVQADKGVFEYTVAFNPPIDSRDLRFRMLAQKVDVIGPVRNFDGVKLYLPIRLPQKETLCTVTHPVDGTPVNMTISFLYQKRLGDRECIHLLNVQFRRIMNCLGMLQINRNHYDPRGSQHVRQHKLEVWPGYVTAVNQYEGGIFLNCDVSHRVLRTETVYTVMGDIFNQGGSQDDVLKIVMGCTVLTRYNNKTYRIDDIDWSQNPLNTFSTSQGEVTYVDYYKKHYNIETLDPKQPLLLSRQKRRRRDEEGETRLICLIPQLCYMTGLTDQMRKDFKIMKDISTHMRVTPDQRQASLMRFIRNVNSTPEAKKLLSDWGLELAEKSVELEGRQFPPEKILFSGGQARTASVEADWTRDLCSTGVLSPVSLRNWIVVYPRKFEVVVREFLGMYKRCAPQLRIEVYDPQLLALPQDSNDAYVNTIKCKINDSVQLFLLVFGSQREDRYNCVKQMLTCNQTCPSQVVVARTISDQKKLRSVTQKIMLQVNCKLGGELWAVEIPIAKSHVMICGIDSYHDAARKGKSIGALVASLNKQVTRWHSTACEQDRGQELIDQLRTGFMNALLEYRKINQALPDRVIIYRDGVSDGQLDHSYRYEVPQIMKAFSTFENYKPRLSFVIVQKRINTRIFCALVRKIFEHVPFFKALLVDLLASDKAYVNAGVKNGNSFEERWEPAPSTSDLPGTGQNPATHPAFASADVESPGFLPLPPDGELGTRNRFYIVREGGGEHMRFENPPPGSVLDHSVTRYDWYDFFLVSQHVRQGTVSPTHYIVLHDESGFDADKMQRLTYKMTHLYYNWPGTIRVPAPCQAPSSRPGSVSTSGPVLSQKASYPRATPTPPDEPPIDCRLRYVQKMARRKEIRLDPVVIAPFPSRRCARGPSFRIVPRCLRLPLLFGKFSPVGTIPDCSSYDPGHPCLRVDEPRHEKRERATASLRIPPRHHRGRAFVALASVITGELLEQVPITVMKDHEHKGLPYCHLPCYQALFGPQLFGHGSKVESHSSFGKSTQMPPSSRLKLERKLSAYNRHYEGKSGELRSREVNGRLVLEGVLRIYWGVTRNICLKGEEGIQIPKPHHLPVPNSHSPPVVQDKCAVGKDGVDDHAKTLPAAVTLKEGTEKQSIAFQSLPHAISLSGVDGVLKNTNNEEQLHGVQTNLKFVATVDQSPASQPPAKCCETLEVIGKRNRHLRRRPGKRMDRNKIKRRSSINGHFYDRTTSVFVPPHGSVAHVWITSLVPATDVISLLLDKYKVDASPNEFALCIVWDNGERQLVHDDEYPLALRVLKGPQEDVCKFFLLNRFEAEDIPPEVAQYLPFSLSELSIFLEGFYDEEELEVERVRLKFHYMRYIMESRIHKLRSAKDPLPLPDAS